MRLRGVAIGVLCTLFIGASFAADDDQDELKRIPDDSQHPQDSHTDPASPAGLTQRIYIENAFTASSLRKDALVPYPAPAPFNWQERLFLDARKEWSLSSQIHFTYSGRLNLRAEDDVPTPNHENVINDLREAYVGWRPLDTLFLDVGRINLKSGVALGYNPTDFFKTRAVVEPLSADPTVLREDRLGTLMMRGQELWAGGSLTAVFAPGFSKPSPIYSNTHLPSFDPMFDRTNAENRFLVKGTADLAENVSPELLLYRERNQTRIGANIAENVNARVVAYLEWSGGRHPRLIDEALNFGRETGTFPVTVPKVLKDGTDQTFKNQLSVGASYVTQSKITVNIEYLLNQGGFSRRDWDKWFAAVRGTSPSSAIAKELWYIRGYALDQQEPISENSMFVRADWVDAFIPKLELIGFVDHDLGDRSGLLQLSADYYLSDTWTIGALVSVDFGPRQSDFGSLQGAVSLLFKVARYY
jgi:hypothetical protein